MMRSWIALGSAITFLALAISVDLGVLTAFDVMVRDWARPHDVWGPAQVRADFVVEGMRPIMMAGLLTVFTLACCVRRRSMRPAAFVGVVGLSTATLAIAVKIAVNRPDPHGWVANHGGSFPSGHMISVTVCLGLVVLLAQPRGGPLAWLVPAVSGGLMAVCLLLQAAHWSTDIVGGALLATSVLAVASAQRWRGWLHGSGQNDQASKVSGRSTESSFAVVCPGAPDSRAG